MRKNSVKNTELIRGIKRTEPYYFQRNQRPKNRSDDFCCVCGSSSGFKDL